MRYMLGLFAVMFIGVGFSWATEHPFTPMDKCFVQENLVCMDGVDKDCADAVKAVCKAMTPEERSYLSVKACIKIGTAQCRVFVHQQCADEAYNQCFR